MWFTFSIDLLQSVTVTRSVFRLYKYVLLQLGGLTIVFHTETRTIFFFFFGFLKIYLYLELSKHLFEFGSVTSGLGLWSVRIGSFCHLSLGRVGFWSDRVRLFFHFRYMSGSGRVMFCRSYIWPSPCVGRSNDEIITHLSKMHSD